MLKPTLYLFIFIVFFSIRIDAQNPTLGIVVCSNQDKLPLENVHVLTSDTAVLTNTNGVFRLRFKEYLEIFHIGYENLRFDQLNDIPDTIWLNRKVNIIEEVTISSKREVRKLEKEPKYWVKNFELVYNHLIVFKKSYIGGHTKLALYDLDGNFLNEVDFEHDIEDVIVNCIDQLVIKYRFGYYIYFVSDGKIIKGPKYSIKKYEQIFDKCVLFHDGQWIYEFERYNGLERNIVGFKGKKDTLLKAITLTQLLELRKEYFGLIAYGEEVGTITTNNYDNNQSIRSIQENSDFLSQVVYKAHQKNSFAAMKNGILIANAEHDSLHYMANEVVEKQFEINKRDKIFNDIDKSKTYFLQRNSMKDYVLSEISEELKIQKLLTIKERILKIRIKGKKVFYLVQDDRKKSVKLYLYFERI